MMVELTTAVIRNADSERVGGSMCHRYTLADCLAELRGDSLINEDYSATATVREVNKEDPAEPGRMIATFIFMRTFADPREGVWVIEDVYESREEEADKARRRNEGWDTGPSKIDSLKATHEYVSDYAARLQAEVSNREAGGRPCRKFDGIPLHALGKRISAALHIAKQVNYDIDEYNS